MTYCSQQITLRSYYCIKENILTGKSTTINDIYKGWVKKKVIPKMEKELLNGNGLS